jgi:hypothetical protein
LAAASQNVTAPSQNPLFNDPNFAQNPHPQRPKGTRDPAIFVSAPEHSQTAFSSTPSHSPPPALLAIEK